MVEALLLKCVWLFLPLTLNHVSADLFSVVVPKTPITGLPGASVILPCALSDNLDARKLDVRWYRPLMFNSPFLLYQNEMLETSTDEEHRGRVSLVGPLEKGILSLKLDNLKLTDKGDYMCHVSSDRWYDKKNMSLIIQVVGSSPVLFVADARGGKVNVSCHSHGWLPKPSLSWRDSAGRRLKHPNKHTSTKVSDGLFSVSSWLMFSPSESSWLSCSVALPNSIGETRESRVMPHVPTEMWKVAFIATVIFLLLFIIGVGVYCVLRHKGLIGSKIKKAEETHTQNDVEDQKPPTSQTEDTPQQNESTAEWEQMKKFKVNITIDPPSPIFTLCKEEFSSGQQYWEVKVMDNNIKKLSWYVGVATDEAERKDRILLAPQNGFWVLFYEVEKGFYVRQKRIAKPLPGVSDDLTTVGVFLDCDNHTLSFYNADAQSLIYTHANVTFTTSLRPLISPGIRDSHPVHIC